jgi:hypothetical protein
MGMDVTKMLQDLREEREQIEEAILSLERLARGRGKRRGRPPAWLSEMRKENKPSKGKGAAASQS